MIGSVVPQLVLVVALSLASVTACAADENPLEVRKQEPERKIFSDLRFNEVKKLVEKGITLQEFKKKIEVCGYKSSSPKFARYYMKDGVIDVPKKLGEKDRVRGYRLGIVR